jgi:predicted ATP-dependent endonuclease of OLD family
MKIIKFRIKNYKSIIDSGDCYPSDRVSIFAGKNEAGKSSILEALSDFNYNTAIRDKAKPIKNKNSIPVVEIAFEFTDEFWTDLVDELNIDTAYKNQFLPILIEMKQHKIIKTYPSQYEIQAEVSHFFQQLKPQNWNDLLFAIDAAYAILRSSSPFVKVGKIQSNLSIENLKQLAAEVANFGSQNASAISALSESDQAIVRANFATLKDSIERQDILIKNLEAEFINTLLKKLPTFILFSSFDDVFPNEIPFSELVSNKWITDLSAMSDIDVKTITSTDRSARKKHKHEINIQLNNDFSTFWSQDLSKLSIDWDNEKLEFWIEEDGDFYPPEIRSQGRRWHLAFYIRVAARSREGVPNVILIDEPGLYLHATAQRDILKHLENASSACQIFLSTHSPYLIETDKLDRIRLIQRTPERGTFIENKVHAVSDKETLTPILTAIGLELNQGIFSADKLNNVIVEGPSDYFYLIALRELIGISSLNFVSGGSSGNMPKIGTILQGWGTRVIYLYDNDQAYKDAQKSLKKEWLTLSKDWLLAHDVDGAIEDIFTKQEFAVIINTTSDQITEKNSQHLKTSKKDKVLPARQYLELVRSDNPPELSAQTRAIVTKLFEKLNLAFETYKH